MSATEAPLAKQSLRGNVDLNGLVTYKRHVRLVDVAMACGLRESRQLQPLLTSLSINARSVRGMTGKWLIVVDPQRILTASRQTTFHGLGERRDPMPRTPHEEYTSDVVHNRIEGPRIRIAAYLLRRTTITEIARVEGIGRRTVTRDLQVIRREWGVFQPLAQEAFAEALTVADDLRIGPLLHLHSPFRVNLLAACFNIVEGQQQIVNVARDIARLQERHEQQARSVTAETSVVA